ncbi:MAG: hypothetical protein COA58_12665 [Bacteroidetes bacterium]|nr:MAG: hypothetical protein COA58_12665 [Bacteroidota bacterium]
MKTKADIMKNALLTLTFILCFGTLYSQTVKKFNVYFDVDKYTLKEESVKTLEQILTLYNENYVTGIGLSAHTDFDASDDYNKVLSQNRARSVVDYLTARNIKQSEMKAGWHGEQIPIASNSTLEGKQLNRRVEISLEYKPFTSADEILERIRDEEQHFEIPTNEDYSITASNGSEIFIPQNAFVDDLGRKIGNRRVVISIEEALSAKDGITSLLVTETESGEMLESGGMIKVTASLDGKPLQLRGDKALGVDLPSENLEDGMSVFTGSRNADGLMRWNITKDKFAAGRQDIIGAPLRLDLSVFEKFVRPIPAISKADMQEQVVTFPVPPSVLKQPRMPRMPKEVNPDKVVTGIKAWFTSDARKEEIAQEIYDERYEDYEGRLARYQEHKKDYDKDLAEYKQNFALYEEKMADISDDIEQHIDYLKKEYNKHKRVYDQARINYGINYIRSRNDQGKFTSVKPEKYIYRVTQAKMDFARSGHLEYLANQLAYYNMLSRFDAKFIAKNFVKDNEISISKMRKYYSKHRRSMNFNRSYSLQNNKLAHEMMQDKEVKEMINLAISKKFETDAANGISTQGAVDNFYSAGVKKLGWINCDRFSKIKFKVAAKFAVAGVVGERVMVYIKKFKSLMSTSSVGEERQVKIPVREKAKVIHIMAVEGKPQLSIVDFVARKGVKIRPDYKEVSLEELKTQLAAL